MRGVSRRSVLVPVVQVRVVRMPMREVLVGVRVGVRFAGRVLRAVGVMMVFIMRVQVLVECCLVPMQVRVAFG